MPKVKTAVVFRGGKETTIPIEQVGIDDVFVVRPGESVPVDGVIIEGSSAIDAADIVLMKSKLCDVPAAIRLSRATLRNIRENLFWAFFYNVVGIPLAAGVWISAFGWKLNPMFGAAVMSLSSFCVVSNALRLNLFQLCESKHNRKIQEVDISETIKLLTAEAEQKEQDGMKTLKIEGMMCGHCEASVKKALEGIDGVESAVVSHEIGTAQVILSKEVPDEVLKEAVEAKDYMVTGIE